MNGYMFHSAQGIGGGPGFVQARSSGQQQQPNPDRQPQLWLKPLISRSVDGARGPRHPAALATEGLKGTAASEIEVS